MKSFLARLGPGLLYAGAAVGVSHLVQSTRAGSNYGFIMILVVIFANVVKYPFFKAGPLYTASTGRSLLEGFQSSGKWAMGLFYLVTVSSMFAVQAVVSLITASVLSSIFHIQLPLWLISAGLLIICSIVLLVGKYALLNKVMKMVIILLTITTVVSLIAAFFKFEPTVQATHAFSFSNTLDLFFLIALLGWMPAPLDISLWHSEWTLEAKKSTPQISLKAVNFDFKIGYWGTTFLAVAFVSLGAMILYGSKEQLSSNGSEFAAQLIQMYTNTLGNWSFVFVAIAAFTTMFSTTLTVLDAYPRILVKSFSMKSNTTNYPKLLQNYSFWLFIVVAGAIFTLCFQLKNMKQMVDFATTVSFLTAPILASLIYMVCLKSGKVIFSKWDKIIAWIGLFFLYAFSLYYLFMKLKYYF